MICQFNIFAVSKYSCSQASLSLMFKTLIFAFECWDIQKTNKQKNTFKIDCCIFHWHAWLLNFLSQGVETTHATYIVNTRLESSKCLQRLFVSEFNADKISGINS